MTEKKRTVLFIVISVMIAVLPLIPLVYGLASISGYIPPITSTKTDIKYYDRLLKRTDVLPQLDELGDTRDLDFRWTCHKFISDAYLLTVTYDEKTYSEQKQIVLQKYEFEEKPIKTVYGYSFTVRFSVDGFDFGVLSMSSTHGIMPNIFYCIGTSDSENKIIYLYYVNAALENIPSWETFLHEDCGWK